jgi:surfactin synthase thioesterase subunit
MSETFPSIWQPLPRKEARKRLLCFPYAGGGANIFRGWEHELRAVELGAVQLPGREWRRNEKPYKSMSTLVDYLLPEISAWLDDARPSFFFGYSMGAALAYELATRIHQSDHSNLQGLFVAACRAPQLFGKMPKLFRMQDDEFVAAIKRFGGLPDIIQSEPDLLKLALPALRADFEVLGTYLWQRCTPLPFSVTVYGATQDPLATRADLAQWREQTSNDFKLRLFSGGHFFINDSRPQLLKTLDFDLALV